MGRTASGVRGIRLRDGDYAVGSDGLKPDSNVFVISEKGYGKQTPASDYPIKGRGGKGIKTSNITEKNGSLAGLTIVDGTEDIMGITDKGVMIRFNVKSVSTTGRSTMGVHLINLDDDAKVSTIAKVEPEQPEADDEKNLSNDENSTEQTESSNDQKDSQDSSSNQE